MGFFQPNIEKMKAKKDVGGLTKALKDKDEGVRVSAAVALGEIGEPAVEPLIQALRDESGLVRGWAAGALGNIGDVRAVGPLTDAFIWSYADGADIALVKIGEPAVKPLAKGLRDYWMGDVGPLGKSSEQAIRFIKTIGMIGGSSAVKALRELRDALPHYFTFEIFKELRTIGWKPTDINENVYYLSHLSVMDKSREKALKSICNYGSDAVAPLIKVLDEIHSFLGSRDEKMVENITLAFGRIGDKRAIEPLIKILDETIENYDDLPNLEVGRYAANSLIRFGDSVVEPLIKVLKDKRNKGYHDKLAQSIYILGEIGDERAVEPILEVGKRYPKINRSQDVSEDIYDFVWHGDMQEIIRRALKTINAVVKKR